MDEQEMSDIADDIAIIGMAGSFPGARSIDEYWKNLCAGRESIAFFSDEELAAAGVAPEILADSRSVKAGGVLEDISLFDASFFDFTPREAEITDPQHRLFLQWAWEALENAGYDAGSYEGKIGVYAGSSMSTYVQYLYANKELMQSVNSLQVLIGNDKDHLTTRTSYKLNLTGPSITVGTTCSTSLVAVHLARQSLLNYHCDMALAGAVAINIPQESVYIYEEGNIISPDGHCRAFDANAMGTIFSNGGGIVVLKRLEDALADGDYIHAIIKGSAVNNDGTLKVGYTAPSVTGQTEVVAEALAVAEVSAETVTYVEAHGTGTSLGDPIEIAALTQAFRLSTDKQGYCAIGSVKTNIGHLDTAAGMAGLIKTVLALKHKMIPPSLHFEKPNPKIDFANSPFYVNTALAQWPAPADSPRRAGITALGIGGTNAHIVLEEAAFPTPTGSSSSCQLLLLSCKTPTALEEATSRLASYLRQHSNISLADVAYTTQVGRKAFDWRRMVVCSSLDDAIAAMEHVDPQRVGSNHQVGTPRNVVFMFPGQGTQYVHMTLGLYKEIPTFRKQIDYCSDLLKPLLGLDLRDILYSPEERATEAANQLKQTALAQPALFVVEYALARLWIEWGIHPSAMIGHSIGEYVAACLAEVFSLEDALKLVVARGKLMQALPDGAMLAVPLPAQEVAQLLVALEQPLSLAAINGPALCVVAGTTDAIDVLSRKLAAQGIEGRLLHTSHAFHSAMMEPALSPLTEIAKKIRMHAPKIPYISNVTGTWVTQATIADPRYWATHMRQTVRFADGLRELLKTAPSILLEVGPGRTLSTFARQLQDTYPEIITVPSLRHPQVQQPDYAFLLTALGQLWLEGHSPAWAEIHQPEQRHRLPLPTYPFERQHYWVDHPMQRDHQETRQQSLYKKPDVEDWFYLPSWLRSIPAQVALQSQDAPQFTQALLFIDSSGLGTQIAQALEKKGIAVWTVIMGEHFRAHNDHSYTLNPQQAEDYDLLLTALQEQAAHPTLIVHLWSVTGDQPSQAGREFFEQCQQAGFYSLLFLCQALEKTSTAEYRQIIVVSDHLHDVTGQEILQPEKATVSGLVKVLPQEHPQNACRNVDIILPASDTEQQKRLGELLTAECMLSLSNEVVAYRGERRWVQSFEKLSLARQQGSPRLRNGGTYLIIGGLADIGLTLSAYLAEAAQARLILVGHADFPARVSWENWLAEHGQDNQTSVSIKRIQEMERLGARIEVRCTNIAEPQSIQRVIQDVYDDLEVLHGVIYILEMGEKDFLCSIQETERAQCESYFHAKASELFELERALDARTLDFCLLVSSLSSILGGLQMATYSAVNNFMDVFVQRHNQTSIVSWTNVNWDAWNLEDTAVQNSATSADFNELAMIATEAQRAFQYLLSLPSLAQVILSTANLEARIKQWLIFSQAPANEATRSIPSASLHPRPKLKNSYVAPANEIEQLIASIWQELLGIGQIGVHDNFFDLGGHSLLATRLIVRLRDAFGISLPLSTVFATPTIAGFANVIAQSLAEYIDSETLAALEQLSPEEVQTLLASQERDLHA